MTQAHSISDDDRFDEPVERAWNHLESIRSILVDLRGSGSLAQELIQNADDAKGRTAGAGGAETMTFRFTDEALVVEDDGGFRRCSDLRAPICELERDGGRRCDFHAFAELGAASKRGDPTTTGAFGIGFLSVYQVTDAPEVLSAGVHWVVDEAGRRVLPCRRCERPHIRKGTQIVLPWARERTWLRDKLGGDTVDAAGRERLMREFVVAIPDCMLFLRRLRRIEVRDGSRRVAMFRRSEQDDRITISGPEGNATWHVVRASFDDEAKAMREAHPSIIGRRPADVTLALRADAQVDGRLYATLPTQVATELPLHLDAAFFPGRDRKGILLSAGPESEWNRLAISAAARSLADGCEPLSRQVGPERFWQLVSAASRLDSHHSLDARALHPIWDALAAALPTAEVMLTSTDDWEVVSRTILPPPSAARSRLLADLGVPTVSARVRRDVPWQRLRLRAITLGRLVEALEALGCEEGAEAEELPEALRAAEQREALRRLLAELTPTDGKPDDELTSRLRDLPLWEATNGRFHSFEQSWVTDRATADVVSPLLEPAVIVWPRSRRLAGLARLADHLTTDQVVETIADADEPSLEDVTARRALRWLERHLPELEGDQLAGLRDAPIIPTTEGLATARGTVRPGGFKDHLSAARTLDESRVDGLEGILAALEVQPLSFAEYVRTYVPRVLGGDDAISTEGLVELIRDGGRHREELDADPRLMEILRDVAGIPCRDGRRRQPTEVYFDAPEVLAVLGDDPRLVDDRIRRGSGAASFLRDLGVADAPRAADVVARVERLSEETQPDRAGRAAMASVLSYVAKSSELHADAGFIESLTELGWLPAAGDDERWHRPDELYGTRHRDLFSTSGRFIALPATQQTALRTALDALGVRQDPLVEDVVAHVRNLAAVAEAPPAKVMAWLDGRAHESEVQLLRDVAFLSARDGSLRRPGQVFREPHVLSDRLPVLEPRLRRYGSLLDELEVLPRPRGDQAVAMLEEVTAGLTSGASVEDIDLRIVRACWRLIDRDVDVDLSSLEGQPVVPGRDGTVWAPADVVFDDQPDALAWLEPTARARVVPEEGLAGAFTRAGVASLASSLHAEVLGARRFRRDRELEGLVMDRQRQLAQIVLGERGDLALLIAFARGLRARSSSQLRVRYSLRSLPDIPASQPAARDAYYDRDTGQLFVTGVGLQVSWPEIALCVKDAVLPDKGPAAALPIEMVLVADDDQAASALLRRLRFSALPDGTWEEIKRVQADWEADRDDADDPDVEAEPETEADEDDEQPDAGQSRQDDSDSHTEDDDEDDDDEHEDDDDTEDHEHDDSGHDGHERGGRAGRTGSGGGRQRGGAGASRDAGRGRGRGARASAGRSGADRRLVSYVAPDEPADSRNEQGGERSEAGDAGVDLVIAHLRAELRGSDLTVRKMPDKNKGFDVLVVDRASTPVRWIEVKSTEDRWGARGVGLSSAQFRLATEKREAYWLYVVEHLYEHEARIWWIQDPAGAVATFQYDEGWGAVAAGRDWVQGARR